MRVIIDTSVWSLALRRKNFVESPETEALRSLVQEGRVVLPGMVRQEILSGIREHAQFERLAQTLDAFPDEPLGKQDRIDAAALCNLCLRHGITAGNTDCLIAALAISRGHEVLTTDRDFELVAKVAPLKLYAG